jgi:CubicO group peptidase (beta-lactamase class C family)
VKADPQIDAIVTATIGTPGGREPKPGCAVGVLREGKVVHANGYGFADLEHCVRVTSETVFHVASLSKQFTAFAVLMLAADGKLSLDDVVGKHVAAMPACAARIRLRHLLHHTSGFRDQWPLLRLAGWRDMDERTEDDVLGIVRRQEALNFAPGEGFTYCNTGYTLLAHVVRQVSGESLRRFTTKRIFEPLGMEATHFRDDHRELLRGRAYGYTDAGPGPFGLWVPNFDLVGPTSLHTTVGDLLVWARALLTPKRPFANVVADLLRPGTLNGGRRLGYGAGVGLGRHRGLAVVRHSGWDLGYVSHLALYPKHGCAVAVLGNFYALRPSVTARHVAEHCLAGCFLEGPARTRGRPRAERSKRTGLYRHRRTGWALWIDVTEDGLGMSYGRSGRGSAPAAQVPLLALDHRRYLAPDEVTEVIFDRDTLTVRSEFGVDDVFVRVLHAVPPRRVLDSYAGSYRSEELGATLAVAARGGKELVVTQPRGAARPLAPAYEDAFTDDNKATYMFTRGLWGDIESLTLSAERIHHVRFDRA